MGSGVEVRLIVGVTLGVGVREGGGDGGGGGGKHTAALHGSSLMLTSMGCQ